MGTQNTTLISNFEAVPQTANRSQELHGRIRIAQGTIEVATTDIDDNDIVMLAPVPTGASISAIYLASDDLDSNGSPTLAFDLGLYTSAAVVVDRDCYATASTFGQAATTMTDYRFEAATSISTCGQMVWEDGAQTEDPFDHYYVALTVENVAATAVAGTISFRIEYVMD